MKYIFKLNVIGAWLILGLVMFGSCQTSNSRQNNAGTDKQTPVGIVKDTPFVYMQLEVKAFSPDSVLAKAIITNHWNKNMVIYKPMLPYENYTEVLYNVMEKTTYENVPQVINRKEDYLNYEDGGSSSYIEPRMDSANFIVLQPEQTIEVICNLAKKFQFKEFLKKGQREFKLVYYSFWPYMVDGSQLTEVDSVDQQTKPVYIVASLPKNDDPDLMRVDFKIP